jgi:hypothetical protein
VCTTLARGVVTGTEGWIGEACGIVLGVLTYRHRCNCHTVLSTTVLSFADKISKVATVVLEPEPSSLLVLAISYRQASVLWK